MEPLQHPLGRYRRQFGKTSAVIYAGRRHILAGNQIIRQAWKSDLYEADVAFTATMKPRYKVALLNPSSFNPAVRWNPFKLPEGRNLSAHVSNLSRTILGVVSHQPLSELQNYRRVANAFFAYCAVSKEPIADALRLFEFKNAKLWLDYSADMPHQQFADAMRRISLTEKKDWRFEVQAPLNRLEPFATYDALRQFTSSEKGVDIPTLLKDGYSIFFNGSPSHLLSVEAAQIVNAMFISELLQFGIENPMRKRPIFCFCDEIQEFAPDSFASAIDLTLGAKLRFALIHHHAGQFDERLRMSVETNARIKILGGGLPYEVRRQYAEIAYARQINQLHKKQPRIAHITDHYEDEAVSTTEWDDGRISTTISDRLTPTINEVTIGWDYYSREEVVSRYAETFLVPDRTFTAILPDGRVQQFSVPQLHQYLYNSATCLQFIQDHPFATHAPIPERSHHASPRSRKTRSGLFRPE
jgi:hypothetical protein